MLARSLAVLVACGAALAFAADPAPPVTREFKLVTVAEVTTESGGRSEKIATRAGYEYAWKREGNEKTLVLRNVTVKVRAGERQLSDVKMSREGMFAVVDGKPDDTKYEDAPEPLKLMLRDTFDVPLCKLEVDATGKEVRRTLVAKAGAKSAINTGAVTNATLFHPPYPADKDEWEADAAVSAGNGDGTGRVKLTKVPGGKGGQGVKMAGTLKIDGVKTDSGATIKDGKYVLAGLLTYDTARKEWVAGELDIDISFAVVRDTKAVDAKGKMKITFEMLPEKK